MNRLDTFMKHVWAGKNGCAQWTGYIDHGYGYHGGTTAHRFAWELFVSPIPPGFEIDHLCRNRACVNVEHLELVTHRENIRRGYQNRALHAAA